MEDDTMREPRPRADKEYSVQGFSEVRVSSAIEFEITQSEEYSVKATGHEKLLEHLKVEVSGQTLTLGFEHNPLAWTGRHRPDGEVRAVVTMPELKRLVVSGASKGTARGFKSSQDLDLELSGASQAEIDIEAGKATVTASGAGRVTGELKAQDTRLTLSGASRCQLLGAGGDTHLDSSGASQADLSQFQIRNADVHISGAGRAKVNMDGTLNVHLSGASSLESKGNIVLGTKDITGASSMHDLQE
jgi:hypothetical protein